MSVNGSIASAGHDRVLIVSARADGPRLDLLLALLDPGVAAELVSPAGPLPDPRRYQAVLLDGDQTAPDVGHVRRLSELVATGGSLVAIGAAPHGADDELAELFGATASRERRLGEVYARRTHAPSELLARLPSEFAIADRFVPLVPLSAAPRALLQVTWALHDEIVVLERSIGPGRVVVSALGNSEEALGSRSLRTLLGRALRRRVDRAERTLGVAIVGYGPYGGMGSLHATAVGQVEGLRLVAVCDRSQERVAVAQRELPGIRGYEHVEDLAADADVDVVLVATPPASHASVSLRLLQAGKHVVCEKPLCLTLAEADTLIEEARRSNLALTVHQNRRWDPDFLAARRAVASGQIGDLFNVETFVGSFEHPCRLWHSDVSVSGGSIYDWGSHFLDWTLLLMDGEPDRVIANGHKRVWHDVTNLDQVRVRLLWNDGREAEFLGSDVAAVRKPKFYLQGTAGTLSGVYRPLVSESVEPGIGYVRKESHHAEAPAEMTLARYVSGYGVVETRLPPFPAERFAFHRNLADHLLLGEPIAVTPADARRVVAVLAAATESASQGGVPISLAEFEARAGLTSAATS